MRHFAIFAFHQCQYIAVTSAASQLIVSTHTDKQNSGPEVVWDVVDSGLAAPRLAPLTPTLCLSPKASITFTI